MSVAAPKYSPGAQFSIFVRRILASVRGAASGFASLDSGGKVPTDQLATGSPDATKFLRGDRTWDLPPNQTPIIKMPVWCDAANLTAATAFAAGRTNAFYIGRAPRAMTSAKVLCRVTTAATATISWAEVAILKGAPMFGAAPSGLTLAGFLDTSAIWTSLGVYSHTITLTGVNAGDHLWVAFGINTNGTMAQFRAGIADDISMGGSAKCTTQMSLLAGNETWTHYNQTTELAPRCAVELI